MLRLMGRSVGHRLIPLVFIRQFLEGFFSEIGLPVYGVLGNLAGRRGRQGLGGPPLHQAPADWRTALGT